MGKVGKHDVIHKNGSGERREGERRRGREGSPFALGTKRKVGAYVNVSG